MNTDYEVEEKTRKVFFADNTRAVFNNVKWFNADGSFLRLGCDEGYILLNTSNINYMIVDGERVR